MLVRELPEHLAVSPDDLIIEIDLADVEVSEDAANLIVSNVAYPLDEISEKALAKFLNVPPPYIKKCPDDLKVHTLNYFLDRYADVTSRIEVTRGNITAIQSPSVITIPNSAVAQIVSSVFRQDDEVTVYQDFDSLHLDVVSAAHAIEVANPQNVLYRPQVGDITNGGCRFLTRPHEVKAPVVQSYLERLYCTNGMTTERKLDEINIKGTNVDEVIEEMELAARKVLAGLDSALERYASTAKVPVPGSPQAFAHQLAREYNLKREVLDAILAIINQIPEHLITVYDVIQAFTQVTHDLPYADRAKLQALGGTLALDTERMIARCTSCEQLLH
jgi:hypothetical protein